MQTNQKSLIVETLSIENLASNPRNGHVLIETLSEAINCNSLADYRNDLQCFFNEFISSEAFNELDAKGRSNSFFTYTRLQNLLLNLEKCINLISPEGVFVIEIKEPEKFIKLEK